MKIVIIFLLTIFTGINGALISQPLTVVTMPSNSINKMEGNAILNEPIEIWGSARGGSPPYNWQMYVDDDPVGSGVTNNGHFIGINYAFHTLGKRIVKLVVNGDTAKSSIRVHYEPVNTIKIDMMIEKGLLYLYKTCTHEGTDKIYWETSLNREEYRFGGTSAAILAFEEFGHLVSNNPKIDPYADLVGKGLNWILSAYSGQKAISNHPDGLHGTPISDNFTAIGGPGTLLTGLEKGAFLFDKQLSDMYANAFGLLAVIMSQPTKIVAQTNVIESGYFEGWTYFNFILDALDLLYWCQGDNEFRGGWRYYLIENSCYSADGGYDGSCHQWPALVFKYAEDRWGIETPFWVEENAIYGYSKITNSIGGCGYQYPDQFTNSGKTGGKLAAYAWLDKLYQNNDGDVLSALNYIDLTYNNYGGENQWQNVNCGWAGCLYHMYAIKKGLQLQEIESVNNKAWYKDMVAWLSGEELYSLPPGFTNSGHSLLNAYGQFPDGSWRDNTELIKEFPIGTAHALLILIQAVTVLPPVAVIDDLPPQPPNASFRLDGSHSFHLDHTSSIIAWNWDFDGDGQFDDAKGQRPPHPPIYNPGIDSVSLQVVDDHDPPLTSTDKIYITITLGDHPPIAVPIPDALLPCYAGHVNDSIHIDGTESFDPDGTLISAYSWDTDGNGAIGNSFLAEDDLIFDKKYNGQVGLRVTSNGVLSTQEYADIFISDDDLYIGELKASPVYQGTSKVDLNMKLYNDSQSSKDYSHVLVRLFDDNPFTTGNRVGDNYYVNLPIGDSVNLQLPLEINSSIKMIYAYLDADQRIEEWNEVNNYKPVDIIKFGNDDTITICDNSEMVISPLDNDFSDGYNLDVIEIPDPPAQFGNTNLLDNSTILYSPFNLPTPYNPKQDQFFYIISIVNSASGELVGYDTTLVNITVNPYPRIFAKTDTIVCPLDQVVISAGNPGSTYLWSNGATTQTVIDSTTGVGFVVDTLIVTVTNGYFCVNTDTLIVTFDWNACDWVINYDIFNKFFSVYPNPSGGKFILDLKGNSVNNQALLFIYDIYGINDPEK